MVKSSEIENIEIANTLTQLKPVEINDLFKQKIVGLIDLTRLNEADKEDDIALFLPKAQTVFGNVAAIVVYPWFVRLVKASLTANIPVASVANFPSGREKLVDVLIQINDALEAGAEEIDVVFPYQRFLNNDLVYVQRFISACRAACPHPIKLKVILETGIYPTLNKIADATQLVIHEGVDFVKTSTGKTSTGATLEAVAQILLVIRHFWKTSQKKVGIKVSGGIKDLSTAATYMQLTEAIMGPGWIDAASFRIGSSKLIDEI